MSKSTILAEAVSDLNNESYVIKVVDGRVGGGYVIFLYSMVFLCFDSRYLIKIVANNCFVDVRVNRLVNENMLRDDMIAPNTNATPYLQLYLRKENVLCTYPLKAGMNLLRLLLTVAQYAPVEDMTSC